MRKRIIISLVSLFTIFSLGAIFASWRVVRATHELTNVVTLHEVEGMRRDLVISVQAVQGDLYSTRTVMARKLGSIVSNVDQLDKATESCLSCHHRSEIEDQLYQLRDLVEVYKTSLSTYITASANKERIARIGLEAAKIGDDILERSETMSAVASARLAEITAVATSRINQIKTILIITVIVMIFASMVISWYLVRSVTQPIQRLVDATRIIAAGDLGHQTEREEEAEFGELAKHFNAMSMALKVGYHKLEAANVSLRQEISERRQAQRDREALEGQLIHSQKMQALGTLSIGIAHEFNNFLQVINGCVEKLSSRLGTQSPHQRELKMIDDTAQRAADLTSRLLGVGTKADSRPLFISLNERVQHVMGILERTLSETIAIHARLTDDIAPINADPGEIDQVLLNLALNARDAMPDGGLLSIETSHGSTDGYASGASMTDEIGAWAVLKVSDTGHGMDADTVEHVFDPFFTTKAVGMGTGLGLATVYGIVTSYGGQITCRSELEHGSMFEIRLPAFPGEAVAVQPEREPTKTVSGTGRTILFVDDEVSVLEVMRDRLVEHGYAVRTAQSGEAAIEFFGEDSQEVDLVILDLGMPGMGGQACLERILEMRPGTKVLITTGYGSWKHKEEALESGACGFLVKPYRISQILSEIESALDR